MIRISKRILLLAMMCIVVPCAFGAETEITRLGAASDGDAVLITIELTSPVKPTFWAIEKPSRLIFDFPNVALETQTRRISVNHSGVGDVHAEMIRGSQFGTRISIDTDHLPRFGMKTTGTTVVLTILPQPWEKNAGLKEPITSVGVREGVRAADDKTMPGMISASSTGAPPEIEQIPLESSFDEPPVDSPATVRRRFRIKFVSGKTVYINGGSNAGLRPGMNLDILRTTGKPGGRSNDEVTIGEARIVGVATTSAILEVGSSSVDLHVGDSADLLPKDAEVARQNVLTAPANTLQAASRLVDNGTDSLAAPGAARNFVHSTQRPDADPGPRMAGRIGFDSSGITSTGSTPGTTMQVGMSVQSDMRHILGTHWNLEGYWRGRINRHSQFQEPTIEETLNKTYTMQLYYDNPNSRWVAGVGRLYLPWAVSLDTIDGGYFGVKSAGGMTTGIFAGSTPDLTSWHYRPNQRIGGFFTNFEGGDYDRFHYSSTTGAGLTSIGWKLDRPFIFFENEASYKGTLSAYHSLIVDSPQGVTTNGIKPGAGVSHSYFTLHYQPERIVSFDLYHNFFRDVPTAATAYVGTGLVDKLLFQGISGGVHLKPTRYFTLYSTLGASEKTGDTHRSLNQMYGGTWNDVPGTGIRADFHYTKFDSNFGKGDYSILSLSRQMTNRMFWNVQLGKQDLLSQYSTNYDSRYVADSLDINLGRHSYLQSGYTFVDGATLNYREWYLSWGYRLDEGKSNPEYVQTVAPRP